MKGRIKMASGMSKQVYRLLLKKGFDEELSREIAFTYMNTDYTATRMLEEAQAAITRFYNER